ncbi:NAD(P)/FAD-dependent oxidoreductase [Pseudonocardia acaciae]|uniref:NAD(P)/FAD-dependent oxidoreductase n=1 Tax=Pseudonocardia acaciae TaxID=551276 RepID=UPI00055B1EDF|nr:FAD-dependent oxidoreductase [Pseudonocardia acaciae]
MASAVSSVTVVGAGVAGLRVCEGLRERGFDGRITLVGDEVEPPYDRPKLSKEVLLRPPGEVDPRLVPEHVLAGLGLDLVLGVRAERLDPRGRRVVLSDGRALVGDRVVLACGARAGQLPGVPDDPRIRTLRSLSDAVALRKALDAGGHLVIVGGGFIGAEVAASARLLDRAVTVVDAVELPFARILGAELAGRLRRIHRERGVEMVTGRGVTSVGADRDAVRVGLAGGGAVRGDHLLVAVGARPRVDWLHGCGLALDDGVLVDAHHRTTVPEVLACGDVANVRAADGDRRSEHWFAAAEQAEIVARTIVGDMTPPPGSDHYFWSDFYDHHLDVAGEPTLADRATLVDDENGGAVLEMRRGDTLVAVAALDAGRRFRRLRRTLPGAAR